jgi:hypothetical protein
MNITNPTAVNLCIVKINVFKGLPDLCNRSPVTIEKRKSNPLIDIFSIMFTYFSFL